MADSKFMKSLRLNNGFLLRQYVKVYVAIWNNVVVPYLNFKVRICSFYYRSIRNGGMKY